MAGETAATAELLALPGSDAGTITGSPDGEVWYRLEPASTGAVRFQMQGDAGFHPYCDVYRLTGTDPPGEPPWGDLGDWVGWCGDSGTDDEESAVHLLAGEVYLVACYDYDTFTAGIGDFTITVSPGGSPANDDVVDATLLVGNAVIAGTTVGGSEEYDEHEDIGGSQAPSVWYRIEVGGPGVFTYKVESTTPGFNPQIGVFYASGSVSGYADLTYDSDQGVGDGTETPPVGIYGDNFGADLDPLQGGEVFYLRISSDDSDYWSDQGAFEFTVSSPSEAVCLDATDYISGSGSVSIVSGAVRETQDLKSETVDPYESWIGDQVDTLVVPGSAIAASPGFYAVHMKTKNMVGDGNWIVGFRRNGHPLWPGAYINSTAGSTPVTGWATGRAGVTDAWNDPYFMDTASRTWRLPVHPDDEIGVVVSIPYADTGSIDITEICFSRVADAVEAPPFDDLDVPDYPLGVTSMPDRGGLVVNPTAGAEPTNTDIEVYGLDMCVTDDGMVWVLHTQEQKPNPPSFSETYTGPVLQYWDGSSWTVVNDDVAGLGVRRSTYGTGEYGPYIVTMDTDGEDIWVAYVMTDGSNVNNPPYHNIGSGDNAAIRVRKYDVSANSWSDIGPLLTSSSPRVDIRSEAGGYETGFHLKLSPAGRVWVGFCDYTDRTLDKFHGYPLFHDRIGWVAKLNDSGDDWIVKQLPFPDWIPLDTLYDIDWESSPYLQQAEDVIAGGGTATTDTKYGEACVKEIQTAYTTDTLSFTPPAGDWTFLFPATYDRSGPGTGAYNYKLYKDGIEYGYEQGFSHFGSVSYWTPGHGLFFWGSFDGTEVLTMRAKISGVCTAVYFDEVFMYPKWVVAQNGGGRGVMDIAWVESSQYHVNLLFNNPDDPEKPRAVYNYITNDPESVTEAVNGGGGHENDSQAHFFFKYAEWVDDSSPMATIWESMLEDDIPEYVWTLTREHTNMAFGHAQEGMGAFYDPASGKSYMASSLMFSFNGGDTMTLVELGPDGPIKPQGMGRTPGIIGGDGGLWDPEPGRAGGRPWGWDIHVNCMAVDYRGNLWVTYYTEAPSGNEGWNIAHLVDTGTGGWIIASDTNLDVGYVNFDGPGPVLRTSPDGTKLYALAEVWMWDDPTYFRWITFGVWEMTIVEDAHIPLIEQILGTLLSMNWRSSDRQIGTRVLRGDD